MATARSDPQEADVRLALSILLQMERMWEGCAVGLLLIEAHLDNRPITADVLAQRVCGMSRDTARRRLDRLADLGRVQHFQMNRRHFYRPHPEAATETLRLLNEIC